MTTSAQSTARYGVRVSAINDARRDQRKLDALQKQMDALRARRDEAIWVARTVDGLTVSDMERELGLSRPALYLILKVRAAAHSQDPQ